MSTPTSTPQATIHKPPTRPTISRPSLILYGAIQGDPTKDWQTSLAASLSDLSIDILNPRCDAWNSTWVEDISFAPFKEQVAWEMDYASIADVIVFNFVPGGQLPITLLELGMYAGTGKAIVCCPEGFWKRGNVQMVCERYRVELVGEFEELKRRVREKMVGMVGM